MAAGFQGGVGPGVQGDAPQRLPAPAEAVEVLGGVHADPVGRRHGPVREPPLHIAADPPSPLRDLTAPGQLGVGGLPYGAEAQHVAAQPGGDRQHGGDDRAGLAGRLRATVVPGGMDAQGLLHGGDATLAVPAHVPRTRVGGQPVDVGQLETGVGHRGQAGVDGEGQGGRIRRRPISDIPIPVRATRASNLSGEAIGRGGDLGQVGEPGRVGLIRDRLEQRHPDVVAGLEAHLHGHAHVEVLERAADDVGRQPDAGVLHQRHGRHDVGGWEVRSHCWWLTVLPMTNARPETTAGSERRGVADRAHDGRGVEEQVVDRAPADPEAPVGAGGPEEPRLGRDGRQRTADGAHLAPPLRRATSGPCGHEAGAFTPPPNRRYSSSRFETRWFPGGSESDGGLSRPYAHSEREPQRLALDSGAQRWPLGSGQPTSDQGADVASTKRALALTAAVLITGSACSSNKSSGSGGSSSSSAAGSSAVSTGSGSSRSTPG